MRPSINREKLAPVFINVPKEQCHLKEELGMTWAGIIKLGLDSVEKNKQFYKMIELIDKQAREIETLKKFIRNGNAIESET
jgi:hypothetical protein